MNEMTNLMLDLETTSIRPNAGIRSIGACFFDEEEIGLRFSCNISLASVSGHLFHLDLDTMSWWDKQSVEARNALNEDQTNITHALLRFSGFINPVKDVVKVWGNGAGFDNVILQNAYKTMGLELPWNFRNDRCMRTLKNLFPLNEEEYQDLKNQWIRDKLVSHIAEHDAVMQAQMMQKIMRLYPVHLEV